MGETAAQGLRCEVNGSLNEAQASMIKFQICDSFRSITELCYKVWSPLNLGIFYELFVFIHLAISPPLDGRENACTCRSSFPPLRNISIFGLDKRMIA